MSVKFAETFDGPAGSLPDTSRWRFASGPASDDEAQVYTDRNAVLDGTGHLVITARRETATVNGSTRSFTSSRLMSRAAFTYGTFSARIRLDPMVGAWPAFWLLGADVDAVGWPACGEVDILEALDGDACVYGSIHGGTPRPFAYTASTVPAATPGGWHTYSVRWVPGKVTFIVDGLTYAVRTPAALAPGEVWNLDQRPVNVVLNVAVGGWASDPEAGPFEAAMVVDSVTVTA